MTSFFLFFHFKEMVAIPSLSNIKSAVTKKTVMRVALAILVVVAVVFLLRAMKGGKCECRANVTRAPAMYATSSPAPFFTGDLTLQDTPTFEPRGVEAWRAEDADEDDEEEAFAADDEDDAEDEPFSGMDHAEIEETFAAEDFSGVQFRSDLLS